MQQLILISLFAFSQANALGIDDSKAIKAVITKFAEAADARDLSSLDEVLDDSYRIVMNQLFGSEEVAIMPREVYLKKIEEGTFGGDDREVLVGDVMINGKTAVAKVTFKGKMNVNSILSFVKDKDGDWKVVSDMPMIKS